MLTGKTPKYFEGVNGGLLYSELASLYIVLNNESGPMILPISE
jgi:hypothetical protein